MNADGLTFDEVLRNLGMSHKSKTMPNGEKRFAVALSSGEELMIVITVAGPEGAWQQAHYHGGQAALAGRSRAGITEHYKVWSGWMAAAVPGKGGDLSPEVTLLSEGDQVSFSPGECHNIYLPAGAVIVTLKVGTPVGNPHRKEADWWPAPQLDQATQLITEADLRNLVDLRAG